MTTAPPADARARSPLPAGATVEPDSATVTRLPASQGRFNAYVELTKPRITMLLLVTCISAMLCAAQGLPDLSLLLVTAVGLALSSGGASALNHVLDRDIDGLMRRTARRPVVTGVVSPIAGAIFGSALMAVAGVMLWLLVNPLTAALALAGGLFYVVVYTLWLKRSTPQNIVIGGAAGAIPPLVGWAAVTGDLSLVPWVLFAIVFMWTPPHFWALALLIREEYATAGVPMLPVVAGERATTRQIWWYTLGLVAVTLVPVATGDFGWVYVIAATLLGAKLILRAGKLRRIARALPEGQTLVVAGGPGHAAARSMFLFSMAYLALLFAAIVVDQAVLRLPIAG